MSDEQSRKAFEAYYVKRQRSRGYGAMLKDEEFTHRKPDGRCMSLGLDDELCAWQESRRVALEEAAKLVESQPRFENDRDGSMDRDESGQWMLRDECVDAIRALASRTQEGS